MELINADHHWSINLTGINGAEAREENDDQT
jgi:hypothetical protein